MRHNEIRQYGQEDRRFIEAICFKTGFMGEPADFYWPHKPSFVEMWTSYYLDCEPESTFVATVEGQVAGYLTGCMDTSRAPTYEQQLMKVGRKHGLLFRPGTARYFIRMILDTIKDRRSDGDGIIAERWPAHLHINLLPEARSAGLGRALMESWQNHLRRNGVPGCHLGTLAENTRAVQFFQKMGFQLHGQRHLVPGLRGSHGERIHDVVMVWPG